MTKHRVRKAPSTDGGKAPHLFVEVEQDTWLEVSALPTHGEIEAHNATDKIYLTYATRAFDIGIVQNWIECSPIS